MRGYTTTTSIGYFQLQENVLYMYIPTFSYQLFLDGKTFDWLLILLTCRLLLAENVGIDFTPIAAVSVFIHCVDVLYKIAIGLSVFFWKFSSIAL